MAGAPDYIFVSEGYLKRLSGVMVTSHCILVDLRNFHFVSIMGDDQVLFGFGLSLKIWPVKAFPLFTKPAVLAF